MRKLKMKKDSNILLALALLNTIFIISGCATIIHGTTQDIGITTDPSGADLCIDGRENYKSPAKITMKRKEDHSVEVTKEGFQKENVNIKSVISGAVAGNIIAGGLIGWGVDAISGGQYRLVPENVDVRLRPLTPQPVTTSVESKESIEEKLDQMKKLKEKGKITEEEYQKMRQEILSSPSKAKITATSSPKRTETVPTEPPKEVLPKSQEKVEPEG